ncbi:hypothetical protein ABT404_51325, partial [Streptomyces hyaluromycini]
MKQLDAAEAAVAETLGYVFRQYPHCGRRAGLPGFAARLPAAGERSVSDLTRMRAVLLDRLAATPAGTDPDLRADLHAAAAFLALERYEVEQLGLVSPGPQDQLAEADVAVYFDPARPGDARIEELAAHLAALPGFLRRSAGRLGGSLPVGVRIRCVEQAALQAARIRETVRAAVRSLPPERTAELAAVAEPAAAACEEFGAEHAADR